MMKLKHASGSIMFFDVETAPLVEKFEELTPDMQMVWGKKSEKLFSEEEPKDTYFRECSLHPEFSKIIVISAGFIEEAKVRIKSFAENNETDTLKEFFKALKVWNNPICGHNILEFDVPFIIKRAIINRIELPSMMQVAGRKPWEVTETFIDTSVLWKQTSFKGYASLETLCVLGNIPTPKDAITGSEVGKEYYSGNLKGIVKYCNKDVHATAQVYQWMCGEETSKELLTV